MSDTMLDKNPQEIVAELDKHIVGQQDAKKAVAVALRTRWRRKQLDAALQKEIYPKNILMIGPTGVGKTEIARRLATLAQAPFIKVEATKFTEVGYVGRDVESIMRDLLDVSIKLTREQAMIAVKAQAEQAAEDRILDVLLPPPRTNSHDDESGVEPVESTARKAFRKKLRNKELDDTEIDIDMAAMPVGIEIMAPPGMEDMTSQLQSVFQSLGSDRKKKRKIKIREAFKQLCEEEAAKLVNDEDIKAQAIENAEQNGIVFIDEFDKIAAGNAERIGAGPSREGVQRDLLPLVEGSTVATKHGSIKSDHVLFIASGAFQIAKPSDLIPELQGRFPIRVELNALGVEDFIRILTEPNASLTEQYTALLSTEGVHIKFDETGVKKLAEIAWQVNERMENIGARRLHTVLERLLEDLSFNATLRSQQGEKEVVIDEAFVVANLAMLVDNEDLSRWIL